jgi:hypothetical protein
VIIVGFEAPNYLTLRGNQCHNCSNIQGNTPMLPKLLPC